MASKIYFKENSKSKYQVRFLNPVTKKETWTGFNNESDALKRCNEIDIEFYKNNKDRLPKGITIDVSNCRFRFHIRLDNQTVKHIKSSKNLSEIIETRNHMIKNLISLF
jgi:hypothetical protein